MHWKPRVAWAALALVVALVAWWLTITITRVVPAGDTLIGIGFDEQPPVTFDAEHFDYPRIARNRFRVPTVLFSGQYTELVVTPATRAVTISGITPADLSCVLLQPIFVAMAPMVLHETSLGAASQPLAATPAGGGIRMAVPAALHARLKRTDNAEGAIRCRLARPIASAPTFTERSMTIRATSRSAVLLDVAALEGIDDLRFSGGVSIPGAGDRLRLLTAERSTVAIEWNDVQAEERRDVILVTVGALAAIAAAMAIEAIRPFVER